ncbi:MAG: patatin [Acidobacteria bacterium]|nr:MAG: patatin [Acidobacteriota bacterium]
MISGKQEAILSQLGVALAGGGISGGIYHIGVLCALEHAIDGLDFMDVDHLIGVSAGAIISSLMANAIPPSELAKNIIEPDLDEYEFTPELFYTPAYENYATKGLFIPRLAVDALQDVLSPARKYSFLSNVLKLSRLIPGGIFSNKPIYHFLSDLFAKTNRTDDFRKLKKNLRVVATDLDSSKSVVFGLDITDVPISKAVQASAALPGIFPPVEIDGRAYVDGALNKTIHASVALEAGCKLMFCVNPIVPVDTSSAIEKGVMQRGKLVDRGLPGILSQTFRTIIHSRMIAGFKRYENEFPDADIVLIEPSMEDYTMFFTNVLSFSSRLKICEHAYQDTLKQLVARRSEIEPKVKRHGLKFNNGFLRDTDRVIWDEVLPKRKKATKKLEHALLDLEACLSSRSSMPLS